jgi:Glycosyl transferase family 11
MIVVNLKGGLGNQMFQYAAGAALAARHGVPLLLDLHSLQRNTQETNQFTPRNAELNIFNLKIEEAPQELLQKFQSVTSTLHYRIRRNISESLVRYRIFQHDELNYPELFSRLGGYTYLNGFFQSEKFFNSQQAYIRKLFTWRDPLNSANEAAAGKIAMCEAVSVHVRRGDYLKPANAALFGNICTAEYYQCALEKIKSEVSNPVFFIFSDDMPWVRNNLNTGAETHYIDFNTGHNSHLDMRLMSLCRHHIIANSSFSWWGAWLNANTNKKVIAPKVWIHQSDAHIDDILPAEWIKM